MTINSTTETHQSEEQRFRGSALRVAYARKRLYLPTTDIHAEREAWLLGDLSEEMMDAEADYEVFMNGLQSFGTTMFESGEAYEAMRDYYCRCEICERRGWRFDQPPPDGYEYWARDFHRKVIERRNNGVETKIGHAAEASNPYRNEGGFGDV